MPGYGPKLHYFIQTIPEIVHIIFQPCVGIESKSSGNMDIANDMEPVLRRGRTNTHIDIDIRAINSVDAAEDEAITLGDLGTVADSCCIGDADSAIRIGADKAIEAFCGVGRAGSLSEEGVVVTRGVVIAGSIPEEGVLQARGVGIAGLVSGKGIVVAFGIGIAGPMPEKGVLVTRGVVPAGVRSENSNNWSKAFEQFAVVL